MGDWHLPPEWGIKALVALLAALWGGLTPVMQGLIGAMVLDIGVGLAAAWVTKTISSDVSFRGMGKKSIVLMLVASGWIVETKGGVPVPIATAIAGYYLGHELISVTENAARANVPVPKILTDALAKLRGQG